MVDIPESPGPLHGERGGPAPAIQLTNGPMVGANPPQGSELLVRDESHPWLLTAEDWPWIYNVTRKRYGPRYDLVTSEQWFRNVCLPQPGTYHPVRTTNAFCISMISWLPWLPAEPECGIVFICTEEGPHGMWEGLKLLRESLQWGKERKCAVWRMASETMYDLSLLAKRIGAIEVSPRWVVRY